MASSIHSNRLARETSPYLLQHAHNPVDWYPWGAEALEAARAGNKPIFLSVGYSTCYWCHVMERQCFENEAIAGEMNRRFINIKVDREERPDVDQLYMTAVQVLTRHGGWPMSVFLTPDLRPFYGGTYFPPSDSQGRPGFPTLLRALEDAYHNRREDVEKSATQLLDILGQLAEPPAPENPVAIDFALLDRLIQRSTSDYDPEHGGFGSAPKFPRETLLELLLVYLRDTPESQFANRQSQVLPMLTHTLDALANGGIRDHLGGGFHRYSTDAQWLVPHFEIMLYDNAMLAWCYVEAFRQTGNGRYAEVARGICDFVLREMTSPGGAFYTAFDAEVDAMEGASYLWTEHEVRRVLTDEPGKGMGSPFSNQDADLFMQTYGLSEGPNFADPHHGSGAPDKNILYLARPIPAESEALVGRMRGWLKEERDRRKQPLLDTKILTSWNALMIRAFAHAGATLQEPRYMAAAKIGAEFLLGHHLVDGALLRTSRDGAAKHNAFLDDYAFLIQALVSLHAASGEAIWKDRAASLAVVMLDKFADSDPANGGFYFTDSTATDLIVRQKVGADSPLPSGNAVAAMALIDLAGHPSLPGNLKTVARNTLAAFAESMRQNGESMSAMVEATLLYLRAETPFTVGPISAGGGVAGPHKMAADVVDLSAEFLSPTLLDVHVRVAAGFHLNAHDPSPGLTGTRLHVAGAEVASIDYPLAHEHRFAFADAALRVYADDLHFPVRLKTPLPPNTVLRLTLSYQACDDTACLPPTMKAIEVAAIQEELG